MKILLLFILCWSGLTSGSTTLSKEEESKIQAKAVMDGVYGSFLKVVPYLYSDENSMLELKTNKAKKDELLKNLTDLSDFFKSATHVEYFDRPGFRPSLETMNSHLTDTINSVNNNNFVFAQKRLSALTALCINCHTQLSASGISNAFGEALNKSKREKFDTDFAYGNYLYLIRQFDESEKYLLLALERALVESRSHELYTSIRRIISIHTKIKFDYKKAHEFVTKFGNDPRMPGLAKENLQDWGRSLDKWKNFNPDSPIVVEDFIKKYLSPLEEIKEQKGLGDNDITLLISAGILSKYLNDHPKTKSAPQILYWLSVAERRLSNTYFFTISDLYLKDCIKLYPASPYAKKCYGLYEDNINFGFTGSGGTDVPPEEKTELTRLRSLIK
ncbi:MAG: hypothetical protein H7177_15360 [Rhizobacter sp.]|nr:hypothetical protein [Bacteriovorax sp.]